MTCKWKIVLQRLRHIAYSTLMPRAAEAIEAWLAAGDTEAFLRIEDDTVVVLPPLPATLTRLYCYMCLALVSLRNLPAALVYLNCTRCPALVALPRLPVTLSQLICFHCSALASLPRLPAALTILNCCWDTALVKLPRLPAALTRLDCWGCAALVELPPLPAALTLLSSAFTSLPRECLALRLPDAYPAVLWLAGRSARGQPRSLACASGRASLRRQAARCCSFAACRDVVRVKCARLSVVTRTLPPPFPLCFGCGLRTAELQGAEAC